jgi:hypothetical protein
MIHKSDDQRGTRLRGDHAQSKKLKHDDDALKPHLSSRVVINRLGRDVDRGHAV